MDAQFQSMSRLCRILLIDLFALSVSGAVSPSEATSNLKLEPLFKTIISASRGLEQPLLALPWSLLSSITTVTGIVGVSGMVVLLAACLLRARRSREEEQQGGKSTPKGTPSLMSRYGPVPTDPGLLRKHSSFKSYTTSIATYPSIRTFYHPHPQTEKLPTKPSPLPLLVFIHGLGGSLAQFHPLLTSLVNVAPCLGVDLPGCGLSQFAPQSWDAYSHEALVQLLDTIIFQHCDSDAGQELVLIGHSMGCSLSISLSSSTSAFHTRIKPLVAGVVAICPKVSNPRPEQVAGFKKLLQIPTPIFDLWRKWDQRGDTESASVKRFLGNNADQETKRLQVKFNAASRSGVFRRMAWGALPMQQADGGLAGGLPGPEIWAGTSRPLFVVAGADDNVTKPEEIAVIRKALGRELEIGEKGHILDEVLPQASAAPPELEAPQQDVTESPTRGECNGATASSRSTMIARDNSSSFDSRRKKRLILKTSILPSPATHALLYDQACYRTLAGLIQTFLADHIDMRLSLGWQLQYLCKGGKWDVKNLAKWQAVKPVSEPIHAVFRAMKTLREVDESHSPAVFVKDWKDKIKAVVDISHESPVYNPEGLENGGIEYHKFPTVSKIPPTREEVASFISLVDRLRLGPEGKESDKRLIGVHCHYGFNRTGFFICSYLVERQGFTVQQAIDEFQKQRPPGIRHDHFLDTLFVRYCIGLKRAPTF